MSKSGVKIEVICCDHALMMTTESGFVSMSLLDSILRMLPEQPSCAPKREAVAPQKSPQLLDLGFEEPPTDLGQLTQVNKQDLLDTKDNTQAERANVLDTKGGYSHSQRGDLNTRYSNAAQRSNAQGTQRSNVQATQHGNVQATQHGNVQETQGNNVQGTQGNNVQETQGNNIQETQGNNIQGTQGNNIQGTQGNNVQGTQDNNVQGMQGNNVQRTQGSNVQATRGKVQATQATKPTNKKLALNVQERIRALKPAQQRKTAATGEQSERVALERMYGKAVWEALLRNPRLTPPEAARIARMASLPTPLLELIANNRAWLTSPQVRRALLSNHRLSKDLVKTVLRAIPRSELKLMPKQVSYPSSVRELAAKMLR